MYKMFKKFQFILIFKQNFSFVGYIKDLSHSILILKLLLSSFLISHFLFLIDICSYSLHIIQCMVIITLKKAYKYVNYC